MAPPPRAVPLHARLGSDMVEMPAYIAARGTSLCSAVVHGSGSGHYKKAYTLLRLEGHDALVGKLTEGDVCDAPLQRRHYASTIELPPEERI